MAKNSKNFCNKSQIAVELKYFINPSFVLFSSKNNNLETALLSNTSLIKLKKIRMY